MTNFHPFTPACAGLLAICPAAMTGWALRASGGLISHGVLELGPPEPEGPAHCDLRLARWLNSRVKHAGPIAAISVVVLPPFMASPMEPDPATVLRSWAALRGIGFDLMTYATLLSSPAGNQPLKRSHTAQAGGSACHAEAIAIAALDQMLSNLEATA